MSRLIEAAGSKKRLPLAVSTSGTRPVKYPCMSSGLTIRYSELQALIFAAKHIPDRTPKRWEVVSKFVSDYCEGEEATFTIELTAIQSNDRVFSSTPATCQKLFTTISDDWSSIEVLSEEKFLRSMCCYPQKNALKPLVLLPPIKECCGALTHIRNRPAFPIVYTLRGTYVAAMYSADCRHCTKKFHLSFCEEISTKKKIFFDPNGSSFLQVTSQTVFEVALLDDITNNMFISAASFESRAAVYNENHRSVDSDRLRELACFARTVTDQDHPWKLNEKRIEDAWFLFALVSFYKNKGKLNDTDFATEKMPSQRVDDDALCQKAWEEITSCTNPWIYHKCKTVGCTEGKLINITIVL